MTTIRTRIFERQVDVRAVTEHEAKMISVGWTAQALLNDGTVIGTANGLPTFESAQAACQDMINNYRESQQRIPHELRDTVNQRDPLRDHHE